MPLPGAGEFQGEVHAAASGKLDLDVANQSNRITNVRDTAYGVTAYAVGLGGTATGYGFKFIAIPIGRPHARDPQGRGIARVHRSHTDDLHGVAPA